MWNLSLLAGPWQIPNYGTPVSNGGGGTYKPVTSYQPDAVFVVPTSEVKGALNGFKLSVFPEGVPVLAGVPSTAVSFPNETAAKVTLSHYWGADVAIDQAAASAK